MPLSPRSYTDVPCTVRSQHSSSSSPRSYISAPYSFRSWHSLPRHFPCLHHLIHMLMLRALSGVDIVCIHHPIHILDNPYSVLKRHSLPSSPLSHADTPCNVRSRPSLPSSSRSYIAHFAVSSLLFLVPFVPLILRNSRSGSSVNDVLSLLFRAVNIPFLLRNSNSASVASPVFSFFLSYFCSSFSSRSFFLFIHLNFMGNDIISAICFSLSTAL